MYMFRDDFRDYAEFCFKEFGDRVKHWITLNEPLSQASGGYADGLLPPARCSSWQKLNCTAGDSGTEPYLAAHHEILAHASAVEVYRPKYQVRCTKLFYAYFTTLFLLENCTPFDRYGCLALDTRQYTVLHLKFAVKINLDKFAS